MERVEEAKGAGHARTKSSSVRAGKALIILGVAVWPAWGLLYLVGLAPNIALALILHLVLVMPGEVLLRRSRPATSARNPGKRLGDLLILLGILVWAPYMYLTDVRGEEVSSTPFLVLHLVGVIPGALLRYVPLGKH